MTVVLLLLNGQSDIPTNSFNTYAVFSSSFLDNIKWNDISFPTASHHKHIKTSRIPSRYRY